MECSVESVKTSLARRMMLSAPFFALSAPVGLTLTDKRANWGIRDDDVMKLC